MIARWKVVKASWWTIRQKCWIKLAHWALKHVYNPHLGMKFNFKTQTTKVVVLETDLEDRFGRSLDD